MAHSRQTARTVLSGLDSAASSIRQSSVVIEFEISDGDLPQKHHCDSTFVAVEIFMGTATNCDRQAGTQG
jgi:hypothetical protein